MKKNLGGEQLIILIIAALAYLIGSIPFGYLLAKRKTGKDIRSIGSGKTGATNTFRAAGRKTAIIVGALDFLKGAIPAIGVYIIFSGNFNWGLIFILPAPVIGHIWPIWLKFNGGGGGFATSLGIATILLYYSIFSFTGSAILAALITLEMIFILYGIWKCVYSYTRKIVSAGSITTIVALIPLFFFLYFLGDKAPYFLVSIFEISLLVLFAHRKNIERLFKRIEPPTEFSI